MIDYIRERLPEQCNRSRIIKQLKYEGIEYAPNTNARLLFHGGLNPNVLITLSCHIEYVYLVADMNNSVFCRRARL